MQFLRVARSANIKHFVDFLRSLSDGNSSTPIKRTNGKRGKIARITEKISFLVTIVSRCLCLYFLAWFMCAYFQCTTAKPVRRQKNDTDRQLRFNLQNQSLQKMAVTKATAVKLRAKFEKNDKSPPGTDFETIQETIQVTNNRQT